MNLSMLNRSSGIAVAAAVVVVTGVAVVAAAGTKPAGYTACANAHHALGLSVRGKCAKHFHKVTVGAATVPGLGTVYVKTGTTNLPVDIAMNSGPRARPDVSTTLSLPAGRYSVEWQAVITGTLSHSGAPAGQEYDLEVGCEAQSQAGGKTSDGGFAQDESALTPDGFDAGSDTSQFDFHRALGNVWALTVPTGGSQVQLICGAPQLKDGSGNSATPSAASDSWQIVATKVAAVHGSDTFSGPVA